MAEHDEPQGSAAAVLPASGRQPMEIRHLRLALAVEGWASGKATLYGAAQGLFLALVRAGETAAARQAHDMLGRKPFALGPLVVSPGVGRLVRATLDVFLWDARLAAALTQGTSAALDKDLSVAGHLAHALDCTVVERTDFMRLASGEGAPPADADGTLWVRFVTPTVFSYGRGMDGRHRYGLLPAPELVVGSWLRAWTAAGGPELPFRGEDDWLRDRVVLRAVRGLQSVTVHTGKAPVPGFVGEVALAWVGAQPGGARALRALAGFARFAGTGSKTAYGLGRTEISVASGANDSGSRASARRSPM